MKGGVQKTPTFEILDTSLLHDRTGNFTKLEKHSEILFTT